MGIANVTLPCLQYDLLYSDETNLCVPILKKDLG